jgi:hypothetical protein
MSAPRDFFVGWDGRLPRDGAWWTRAMLALVVAGFLLLGLGLARAIDDPGGGAGTGQEETLQGVLTALPYPTVTMAGGHTVILSGGGKDGAAFDPALDGRTVRATGYMLRRGTLEMLQVGEAVQPAGGDAAAVAREPLGTWRITGEVCDGKCLAGAMRPGIGTGHRACANLCVSGGVPPVFAASGPVEGQRYLLMGDPGGGPLDGRFRALTARPVTLEGTVERRGDLLVFRPDLARAVLR